MGILSFIKGMKMYDNCPIDVTFRTSRANKLLGILLIISGMCIVRQILHINGIYSFFKILLVSFIGIGCLFTLSGIFLLTYRKRVIISKIKSKIECMESWIFGKHNAFYHFNDVFHLEICPIAECFFNSKICLWTIKAYLKRHNGFETVHLFSGMRLQDAEEAAIVLSQILNREIINTSGSILNQNSLSSQPS